MQRTNYPEAIDDLLRAMPLAALGPGAPVREARARLEAVGDDVPATCRAGLWLGYNYLDESHAISQEIETAEGSYWHAILHRREPDAANSKYWWRRVGDHPVFGRLSEAAAKLGWRAWSAAAFVDECERWRDTGGEREAVLREAQMAEWRALFGWCWSATAGRG